MAVIMGMLTGAAGGMIRDILSGKIPLILRREIYATAALAGAGVFVILTHVLNENTLTLLIAAGVTFMLRLAAIKWNYELPVFLTNQEK